MTVKEFRKLVLDTLKGMRDDDVVQFHNEANDELLFEAFITQSGMAVFHLVTEDTEVNLRLDNNS